MLNDFFEFKFQKIIDKILNKEQQQKIKNSNESIKKFDPEKFINKFNNEIKNKIKRFR